MKSLPDLSPLLVRKRIGNDAVMRRVQTLVFLILLCSVLRRECRLSAGWYVIEQRDGSCLHNFIESS